MINNYNGTLVPVEKGLFKAGNRAFLYADRLFETILFHDSKLLLWEEHYFRIMGGACMLRMDIPINYNMDFLKDEIHKTIEANKISEKSLRIRLSIFRADGGLYLPLNKSVEYLIEVNLVPNFNLEMNLKGAIIDVFYDHVILNRSLSSIKGNNSIISVLSSIYADENNLDESIILNSDSFICETSTSNIFLVIGKQILTPPINSGCINGIIREKIIENAESWGYEIQESNIKPFQLIKADEVFLSNSIKIITWVEQYKSKKYRNIVSKDLLMNLKEMMNI